MIDRNKNKEMDNVYPIMHGCFEVVSVMMPWGHCKYCWQQTSQRKTCELIEREPRIACQHRLYLLKASRTGFLQSSRLKKSETCEHTHGDLRTLSLQSYRRKNCGLVCALGVGHGVKALSADRATKTQDPRPEAAVARPGEALRNPGCHSEVKACLAPSL